MEGCPVLAPFTYPCFARSNKRSSIPPLTTKICSILPSCALESLTTFSYMAPPRAFIRTFQAPPTSLDITSSTPTLTCSFVAQAALLGPPGHALLSDPAQLCPCSPVPAADTGEAGTSAGSCWGPQTSSCHGRSHSGHSPPCDGMPHTHHTSELTV